MTKKPSFWTNFGPFRPNFGPQIFLWILPVLDVDIIASNHCMQFQGKLKNQNMRKWKKKNQFWTRFWPNGPNSDCQKIFYFQKSDLVSHQISQSAFVMYNIRKINDPIFRKVSDGQLTDGQTDDESDFIGSYRLTSSVQN